MSTITRTRTRDRRRKPVALERAWDASPGGTYSRVYTRPGNYANLGSYKITKDAYIYRKYPKGTKRPKKKLQWSDDVNKIVLNPFEVSDYTHVGGQGKVYTVKNTGLSYSLEGDIASQLFPNPDLYPVSVPSSRYLDYVVAKAYAKRAQPQHDFGVTLGEMRETLTMLANPLSGLLKLSSRFGLLGKKLLKHRFRGKNYVRYNDRLPKNLRAKKRLENGAEVIDEASGAWLEYRYGIRPLIGEVQNIIKLAQEGSQPNENLQTARSGYRFEAYNNVSKTANAVWGFWFDFYKEETINYHVTSGAYYFNRYNWPIFGWLNNLGLTPWNVPSVMWELVPLSFVVDRFVDVSSFITNSMPKPGIVDCGQFVSAKREYKIYIRPVPTYHYSYGDKLFGKVDPLLWLQSSLVRYTNWPVPKYPVLNPKLVDFANLVDHTLLLWQRLPKWR